MKSDSQIVNVYELVLCSKSKTVLTEKSVSRVNFYYELALLLEAVTDTYVFL